MKYIIEILVVALFIVICLFGWKFSKLDKLNRDNNMLIEHRIDSLMEIRDSITIKEQVIERQTKFIKTIYEHTKDSIILLPDSLQYERLFSNIAKFEASHNY